MKKININELFSIKYGRLAIIGEGLVKNKRRFVITKCDCGKTKEVNLYDLMGGKILSCGCYNLEIVRMAKTHGFSCNNNNNRIYNIWRGIKRRCNTQNQNNYPNYGGRGITYNKKWETFEGFYEDMKDGYSDNLSIDRINNNGNYCKENCRWATIDEQSNNKRSNHILEWEGTKYTMTNLCKKLNISYRKLRYRINTLKRDDVRSINFLINNKCQK